VPRRGQRGIAEQEQCHDPVTGRRPSAPNGNGYAPGVPVPLSRLRLLAVVVLLFAAIFALRLSVEGNEEGVSLLYSLPVALLAIAFGLRAGLVGAMLGTALYAAYIVIEDESADALSYATRAVTFFLLGGLLGAYADRLRAASRELSAANRDLARSNADLERYASVASHDLQEPLRMVSTYTEVLAEDLGDDLTPEDRESMDFVLDGAARMRALIDGLLRFSRVRPETLVTGRVDLAVALDRALENLGATLLETGAKVTHGPLPTTVRGDEQALQQVFQNLVANAVKFRSEAPPQVEVSARRERAAWAVAVRDNGIGIEPAQAERVFELFARGHAKDRYPGAGIGLALCARIVEAHGGTIAAGANPDGGTTITFTLPDEPPS